MLSIAGRMPIETNSLLKKGTGSELRDDIAAKINDGDVPVPHFNTRRLMCETCIFVVVPYPTSQDHLGINNELSPHRASYHYVFSMANVRKTTVYSVFIYGRKLSTATKLKVLQQSFNQ